MSLDIFFCKYINVYTQKINSGMVLMLNIASNNLNYLKAVKCKNLFISVR